MAFAFIIGKAMRSTFRQIVAILTVSAFAIAACSKPHIYLAPEAADKIKTVRLISIIPQAVVAGTVNPSGGEMAILYTGMVFGLIGMAASAPIYYGLITAREHL